MNFENSLSQFGGKLRVLLPLLMIVVILAAMFAYGITKLLPELRLNNALSAQKEAIEQSLAEREADAEDKTFITVLQNQIDDTNEMFGETVNSSFINQAQADAVLEHLYEYASASSVDITNLQSQEGIQEANAELYQQRSYRLQIAGEVPQLMNFIMRIHELGLPSAYLQNFAIAVHQESYLMNMDLYIQISPFADGAALDALPQREVPTSAVAELILLPLVTPTPEPALSSVQNVSDSATAVVSASIECPGTSPTLFQIGDQVVVDFNGVGSLNILPRARQSATDIMSALDVVKDNDTLLLLEGPVCGEWEGQKLWYWYVEAQGIRGWAAEGAGSKRWLCPEAEPECAS